MRTWIVFKAGSQSIPANSSADVFPASDLFPFEPTFSRLLVRQLAFGLSDNANTAHLSVQNADAGVSFLDSQGNSSTAVGVELASLILPGTSAVVLSDVAIQILQTYEFEAETTTFANLLRPIAQVSLFAQVRVANNDAGAAHTVSWGLSAVLALK